MHVNSDLDIKNPTGKYWLLQSVPLKCNTRFTDAQCTDISNSNLVFYTHVCAQYAAKEHQQALDILDMEEPINKRLFEKYLKDENGLKDSTTDWEMSQSSVSDIVRITIV